MNVANTSEMKNGNNSNRNGKKRTDFNHVHLYNLSLKCKVYIWKSTRNLFTIKFIFVISTQLNKIPHILMIYI